MLERERLDYEGYRDAGNRGCGDEATGRPWREMSFLSHSGAIFCETIFIGWHRKKKNRKSECSSRNPEYKRQLSTGYPILNSIFWILNSKTDRDGGT